MSDDKKISRKEKDERILWKKNEVAEYEVSKQTNVLYSHLGLDCLTKPSDISHLTKSGSSKLHNTAIVMKYTIVFRVLIIEPYDIIQTNIII